MSDHITWLFIGIILISGLIINRTHSKANMRIVFSFMSVAAAGLIITEEMPAFLRIVFFIILLATGFFGYVRQSNRIDNDNKK
ncbi:hypothetical protein [Lacticaseibacillus saniviri]|uniref:Uncharacterized protein n=1 Tax=Lacticaseibacillus saniviri JCM 17471 = DSM 24301 TaxID=1293598 RepID=A0A0R2MV04_9LACO|nr:hypothetical protein [Lacticaseibacillus saniviri]KRO17300.1 hypothetical protein IV56_GL000420 [Lacticaseibacillus saniviri JCM 17471 = DSM 24301]